LAVANPVKLTDTCAVFCESELIGHLARGVDPLHLASGVNLSVARRIMAMLGKREKSKIFASGGVAKSKALIIFLSELSGIEIVVLEKPEFNGAKGALIACCGGALKSC
jgi:activator of 2-hydroxyglutaryl-CoA dehydratase